MEQATPRRGVLSPTLIRTGLSDIKRSPDSLRHSYVQLNLEVRCWCCYVCRRLIQMSGNHSPGFLIYNHRRLPRRRTNT